MTESAFSTRAVVVQMLPEEGLGLFDLAAMVDQADGGLGGVDTGDLLGEQSIQDGTQSRGHVALSVREARGRRSASALRRAGAERSTCRKLPGQRGRSARGKT